MITASGMPTRNHIVTMSYGLTNLATLQTKGIIYAQDAHTQACVTRSARIGLQSNSDNIIN